MADIDFNCPHCGQNLNGPEEMAGESIDCPVCNKSFEIPGGIIEVPKSQMAPISAPKPAEPAPAAPPPAPEAAASVPAPEVAAPAPAPVPAPAERPATDEEKGKTVRIELPPEFLAEPEKHIFKIKRIQH